MLSKISAIALLGSSVQAAPTSLPTACVSNAGGYKCSNFPKFATDNAATADAAGSVTLGATPYACVRNNFAYTWPVTKDGTYAAIQTVANSPIRAFYNTAANGLGTFATSTTTVNTNNSGCCSSAEANCPVAEASGTMYTGITVSRITKATSGTDAAVSTYTLINFDFLLGATMQLDVATLGAAKSATGYCDPMKQTLVAGMNHDLEAGTGLAGTGKCTWIVHAAAGTGAPAFSVKSITAPATFTFDLHFAEWRTTDLIYLPTQGVTPTWWGNYDADTYPTPPMALADWKSGYYNWQ
jgi:hypothetical protein